MLSCRGGGKLSRPVSFAKFFHFKLSECDDVSIINIIQVKFSCFSCQIVLYA